MGAYENPVTVVDNLSGQIWANTILNLGNQTSKLLDDERLRLLEINEDFALRLQKIQEQGVKDYDVLSTAMASQGITEQQIYDEAKHFQSLKTDTTSRLLRVDLSPEERVELENNQSMADTALKGLIPYIKNREESTKDYLDEIKNNPNNVGGQGFASMTENEEFQIGTWIDTGFLAGESKMVYDKDKGWGTYYKESPDVESKYDGMEFTIWGTQAANYLTTKVPTVDKSLEGLLQKAGVVDAKNKLTEAFMDINSPNTKVTYNKDGTIAVTTVGANWEAAAIAINESVETLAETELLKDPKTANAVWRNVFQKEEDMKIGLGGEIDKDQKEEFINLLKIRAGRFIPNVSYIPGESEVGKQWTQRKKEDGTLENPNAFQAKKYSAANKGKSSSPKNVSETTQYNIDKIVDVIKSKDAKFFRGKKIAGKVVSEASIDPTTGNLLLYYDKITTKNGEVQSPTPVPIPGYDKINFNNRSDLENLLEQLIARGGDPTVAEIKEIKAMLKYLETVQFPGEEYIGMGVRTDIDTRPKIYNRKN